MGTERFVGGAGVEDGGHGDLAPEVKKNHGCRSRDRDGTDDEDGATQAPIRNVGLVRVPLLGRQAVVDGCAGGASSLPRMTVRRGRLQSVRHVAAPIEGGHSDTVRDAGYYAEITEVTIKHG